MDYNSTHTGPVIDAAIDRAKEGGAIDEALGTKIGETDGAGFHNSIYRGKALGSTVTDAQWAAIKAGTFDDLYIGDYWTISGVNYRIAAFDYYYRVGPTADTLCTNHHVTLVPDSNLSISVMNATDITTGAYVGSKMRSEGLTQAKTTINSAFGEEHVLSHSVYLENSATNGYASGASWYTSAVELMCERNVYGCSIFGNQMNGTALPVIYTADRTQYPLFAFCPDLISNRLWSWLRDVVSATNFAYLHGAGYAYHLGASQDAGVRPRFSIYSA